MLALDDIGRSEAARAVRYAQAHPLLEPRPRDVQPTAWRAFFATVPISDLTIVRLEIASRED